MHFLTVIIGWVWGCFLLKITGLVKASCSWPESFTFFAGLFIKESVPACWIELIFYKNKLQIKQTKIELELNFFLSQNYFI